MTAKSFTAIGLVLITLALVFNTLETWYFGWHLWAKSAQEAACDNFSIVAFLIGAAFFAKGIIRLPVKDEKHVVIEVHQVQRDELDA
ncbi:hypothetical protein [Alicyclobacillus shizuokensis]|uniref:hypothetical protein n=1 Tax=Alicyclobacillus shizuokensis TaxID=392014 RepID=UPI00082A0866|nr:hypothetical protein [Alicyclobacillus shizuokensis]